MEGWLVVMVVAAAVSVFGAHATSYTDCGSDATIQDFSISGCDTPPCVAERPSIAQVNITFTPKSDITRLDTIINANIGGLDFPWPGPAGCPLIVQESCPLKSGNTYKYSAPMEVLDDYPAVTAIVTWKLQDENNIVVFCGVIPVMVV